MSIVSDVIELARLIAKWAREGLSDEEIEARLRDPFSVGADIIQRIEERKFIGEELLGDE